MTCLIHKAHPLTVVGKELLSVGRRKNNIRHMALNKTEIKPTSKLFKVQITVDSIKTLALLPSFIYNELTKHT